MIQNKRKADSKFKRTKQAVNFEKYRNLRISVKCRIKMDYMDFVVIRYENQSSYFWFYIRYIRKYRFFHLQCSIMAKSRLTLKFLPTYLLIYDNNLNEDELFKRGYFPSCNYLSEVEISENLELDQSSLKSSFTSGVDDILPYFIKMCSQSVTQPITPPPYLPTFVKSSSFA